MINTLSSTFEEVQLIYKNKTKACDRLTITSPLDAYAIFYESWDKGQIGLLEESKMLLLDRQLRLMSIASISKGGMSSVVIDPKIVFSIALKRRASRIILGHNHPSGTLKPSKEDLKLTKEFIKAGNILQLPLEDHLIITEDGYCSLITEYSEELACNI